MFYDIKYEKYIKNINVDPGMIYFFYNLDKSFYYNFKIDIKIYKDPIDVPDNIYRFIKLTNSFNSIYLNEIIEVNNVEQQNLKIIGSAHSLDFEYEELMSDLPNLLVNLISKTKKLPASFIMDIMLKGNKLANILLNINKLIEKAYKPETEFEDLINSILKILTSDQGAGFDRAILFKKYNENYEVISAKKSMLYFFEYDKCKKANKIEMNILENKNDLELIEEDEKFLNKLKSIKISEKIIKKNDYIKNILIKNKSEKLPLSSMPLITINKLGIVGELAIMPIKLNEKIYGFIICDNKYSLNPISDEQIEIMEYLKKQSSMILENKIAINILKTEAEIDPLCKFRNRNSYEKYIEKLNITDEKSLGIVMIDIDNFKKINDTYGHSYGDEILMKFSDTVRKYIRKTDNIFRIGGDEFIIFLHNTEKEKIKEIIENILKDFKSENTFTFSAGGVIKKDENIYKYLEISDKNLYISKKNGKGILTFS